MAALWQFLAGRDLGKTLRGNSPECCNRSGQCQGKWNGGHEYGTDLSDDDCWTIIEYMKGL
jgi:hypothetical protein